MEVREDSDELGIQKSMKIIRLEIMNYISEKECYFRWIDDDGTKFFYPALDRVFEELRNAGLINPTLPKYTKVPPTHVIWLRRPFKIPYEVSERTKEVDWDAFLKNMKPVSPEIQRNYRIQSLVTMISSNCEHLKANPMGSIMFEVFSDEFSYFSNIMYHAIGCLNGTQKFPGIDINDHTRSYVFSARQNNGFEHFVSSYDREAYSYTITAHLKN